MFGSKTIICILAIVVCLPGIGSKKSYKGYRVVRVDLRNANDSNVVEKLLNDGTLKLELWSVPSSAHDVVDVQVAPSHYKRLLTKLETQNLTHDIFIDDIQNMVDEEAMSITYELLRDKSLSHVVRRSTPSRVSNQVVGRYANLSEIEEWMETLAHNFPDVIKLKIIGKTYEGRRIYVVKVGRQHPEGGTKPAVYLDGGIHAREWISPATVVYLIYKLILGHVLGKKGQEQFLDVLDWYFVPVANPDGYHHTHTEERLWRKNRSPNGNYSCKGTDLNRNWPYHWGKVTPYTSDNPCSIVYQGSSAGSELETQALMKFLSDRNETIRAFISHHSYTQKWFTRWGYTNSTPPDHEQMMNVAHKAVDALEREGGESYEVGRPFELLYPYTGGSADWAKGVAGIKYSYTVELRDRGKYGFLLPANYVIPVGDELWAAVKVVASQLINETIGNTTTTEDITNDVSTNTQSTVLTVSKSTRGNETPDKGTNSDRGPSTKSSQGPNFAKSSPTEGPLTYSSATKLHSLTSIQLASLCLMWLTRLPVLWGTNIIDR